MQKCLNKIILVWEIIMIDKYWFNYKSSSGFVDLGVWKKEFSKWRIWTYP